MFVSATLRIAEFHVLKGFSVERDLRDDSFEVRQAIQIRHRCRENCGATRVRRVCNRIEIQSLLLGAGFGDQLKYATGDAHFFFHVRVQHIREHLPIHRVRHEFQVKSMGAHLHRGPAVRRSRFLGMRVTRLVIVAVIASWTVVMTMLLCFRRLRC